MKEIDFTKYANSFQETARLGLESIGRLLFHLENPQRDLKFIHIAGTNGKGSISAFLQSILTESGLCCGKYISPNMLSVCERISVDGADITNEEMEHLLSHVREAAQRVQDELDVCPTQFEIWTAAAFLYFKERRCDIVVLETGLGGRKDATNIIPPPEISIIAHIATDHTEYLGDTLGKIAYEKAGIIKKHIGKEGCTISTPQSPEAAAVLEKVCAEQDSRLILCDSCRPISFSPDGEIFGYRDLDNLHSHLLGVHQLDNAAAAIEAAKYLKIPDEAIASGISKARNMGRLEIVSSEPLTIFDGAHNPDGMRALAGALNRYFPEKTKSVIIATMADKDISKSLAELKGVQNISEIFTLSVQNNPRTMSAEELARIVDEQLMPATACSSFDEAFCGLSSEMTVICGSLYLYKDYTDYINRRS